MVGDTVVCDKCKWSWAIDDGGDHPYTCKCGHVNKPINSNKNMEPILTLEQYKIALNEKKSPYDRETLLSYKDEYEKGKEIPFGVKSSLIAQGMIAREGGDDEGKKVKSPEYSSEDHELQHYSGVWEKAESKDDKNLEKYIISGKQFKKKYATDFKGKVAKVFYTQDLNIGSNLGKGSYWNVTQDSLDIYSGNRDEEFDSRYGEYVKDIVYKEIDDNLRIFVKDEIADDLWNNKKLYNKIKSISDGIYDPLYDDYGLVLFK